MKDKHIFSKSYSERKEAVLNALRREERAEKRAKRNDPFHTPIKVLASAALLSLLSVGVFAAVQWIDFRMEQNGDEVHIYAGLNETTMNNPAEKEEKPLRSWRAEDGEIGVHLNIPDLPWDMSEDETASGKYGSEDNSRSITFNGIDLRRADLDQLIGGASAVEQLDASGKTLYVIEKGEADFYNRIAYIVYEEDELVLKLWISYGISDEELLTLASTLTLEETTDTLRAIPIQGEVDDSSNVGIPDDFFREDDAIYEADLLEIGESVRDDNNWFTVTVNGVEVYDNINALNPDCILREDFVERFTDDSGEFISYNRTEVIWTKEEGKQPTKQFGETVSAKKKLYAVTLTMADVTMDEMSEADREVMLKACVYAFHLNGYSAADGKLELNSSSAVVDRKPNAYAYSSEAVYREYLGNNQWKVAYLVDEDVAEGNLVLNDYTGKIYVKIQ